MPRTVDVATYERNKEAADSENKYVLHAMNTGKICVYLQTGGTDASDQSVRSAARKIP